MFKYRVISGGPLSIGDVKGKYLQILRVAMTQLMIKIQKTKGTLFSQTLKVEENKVPLVFFNFGSGAEI